MTLPMQSRLPLPDVTALDAQQKAVYDSILSTRGNLDSPFLAWMHSPELASHAEKLGAFCRYQTALELVESELLILCVAAHHQCQGEQQIHEPIAQSAGLGADIIAQLRQGAVPVLANSRQAVLHRLACELLTSHRLGEETYREAIRLFGERTVVEIVAVIGYYAFVALTLTESGGFGRRLAKGGRHPAGRHRSGDHRAPHGRDRSAQADPTGHPRGAGNHGPHCLEPILPVASEFFVTS